MRSAEAHMATFSAADAPLSTLSARRTKTKKSSRFRRGGAVDEVDEAIVDLLQQDGRLSHGEIAREVGLSRSAVAARTQRLLATGEVEVRGVVHPAVVGRSSLAHVALTVRGAAEPVAAEVAKRADVPFVSLTTGRSAVVAEVRAASPLAIDRAVGELRSLAGVRSVDTLPYVEVVRDVIGPVGAVQHQVDETDLTLLRALQADGRASYVDLAAQVGLSAAGVRRRVMRLVDERVVRIGAVVRRSGSDRQAAMGLGLRLENGAEEVLAALEDIASISFVARTLGRFDVLVTSRASAVSRSLSTLDRVRALPGVHEVESWAHLAVVKETYEAVDLGVVT
jgi:DNA-binding Lrp family transcriptional regulator